MDIGEAMALTNSNNNWMNNPFMYLIWLAFFGGDGFGFGRRGNALTQAELQEGFNNQNVMRSLEGIKNGVCDGFYAMNTNALQGQNQLQRDMCQGFGAVTAGITNTGCHGTKSRRTVLRLNNAAARLIAILTALKPRIIKTPVKSLLLSTAKVKLLVL